jgi:ABC-type uncharacterized transport system substrate-binding protein
MKRREILGMHIGAAALVPQTGFAQQRKRPVVGTLFQGSRGTSTFQTFQEALAALGYGDDTVAVESRWADGHFDRLSGLAAELMRLSPDVLVASSGTVARVLLQQTTHIPIVFAVSDDPVGTGLVASLAHPGGNVTGLSFAQEETVGRELQLLKTMAPDAGRVAVLGNPTASSTERIVRRLQQAAAKLKMEIVTTEASAPAAIEPAFAALQGQGADALVVLGDGLFTSERERIIAFAARHRLPAIYHDHIFVEDGGLMSYGGDFGDNYRGAAVLVDKILKDAKPGDLPVQEPTKFYLYINRKTATTLGLAVPPLLEAQADKIVE